MLPVFPWSADETFVEKLARLDIREGDYWGVSRLKNSIVDIT
jgi:hypothetical protein